MNLPRKVQNFIMCLISNLPDLKQSKSRTSFFADIWKKFLNVSEFNFTLLRTSDMFCFTKTKSSGNYLRIFVTFAAYMLSSISDRAKLYHISLYGSDWDFSTIDIWMIFCEIYYDCQKSCLSFCTSWLISILRQPYVTKCTRLSWSTIQLKWTWKISVTQKLIKPGLPR